MQLLKLQIDQSFAKIGMSQQQAKVEIRQPKAELKLSQSQPAVEMNISSSKLEIDQSEAFADANLKSAMQSVNEWASKGKQHALQSITKAVQEGRRLMAIENGKDSAIPQLAKENSQDTPKQFGLGYMPSSPLLVKFHYTPSDIKIDVKSNNATVDAKINQPVVQFKQGDVQTYLRQKASIYFQIDQVI